MNVVIYYYNRKYGDLFICEDNKFSHQSSHGTHWCLKNESIQLEFKNVKAVCCDEVSRT